MGYLENVGVSNMESMSDRIYRVACDYAERAGLTEPERPRYDLPPMTVHNIHYGMSVAFMRRSIRPDGTMTAEQADASARLERILALCAYARVPGGDGGCNRLSDLEDAERIARDGFSFREALDAIPW